LALKGRRQIIRNGIFLVSLSVLTGATAFASQITTANGEIPEAGTVIGSYLDTQVKNGVYEAIQEVESGGKPSNRYSYMEHKWTFDVPAGSAVTFFVKAYHTVNSEGDEFDFAWSIDDYDYTNLLRVTKTSDDGLYQSAALPPDVSGPVYIRVMDTDHTQGNRSLDTVYVDHMYIESSTGNAPPGAPSDLRALTMSASEIDLSWIDNSSNEDGFQIERSLDGINWDPIATVGVDVTSFLDTNLTPSTTYYYLVQAFNSHGSSDGSNTAWDTTFSLESFTIQLVDIANEDFMSHDIHPITGFPGVGYTDTGVAKFAEWNGSSWDIEIVRTEGGLGGLQVAYSPDGIPCMTFGWEGMFFAERVGSSWIIEMVEGWKVFDERHSLAYDPDGNPAMAYRSKSGDKKLGLGRGLRVARRFGSDWVITMVDSEYANWKSLAFDLQGNPAVAYSADSNTKVKFAHWNGSSWDVEIVAQGDGYGWNIGLAYDPATGWPAIVHNPWPSAEADKEVRFIRWDGYEWIAETVLLGAGPTKLAYNTYGTPYIAYQMDHRLGNLGLRVSHWNGSVWQPNVVDKDSASWATLSLRVDLNGQPTLSYRRDGMRYAFKESP
jgi:hypothetical protein